MGCLIRQPDRRCVDWRARAERAAFYVRGLEELAAVPSIGRAARIDGGLPPEADLTHALYEQYANQIFRYCLHQLGSREEAEDAVQSTFLNAFRGIKRGVVPELESAWLFKIAQNVCLSRRRTTWRRGRIESPTDFEVVEELAPAPSRQSDELIGLQDVLERLPENQRRAILLREWQGLSYREIAAELELSQAAVETLIFRARRALASGLEQPSTAKRRVIRSADLGNVLAAVKSVLLSGGAAAKVAATVAVVSAGTVVAAAPVQQHRAHSHAAPTHAKHAVKHAAARHTAPPTTHRVVSRVAPHEAAVPVKRSHVPARRRAHASAVVARAHVRRFSPAVPRVSGSPDDRAAAPPAADSGTADPTPTAPASPPAAPQADTGHAEVQQTPPPPATPASDAPKKDTIAAGQKGPGDAKKSDSDHRTSGSPGATTTSPPVVRTAPVGVTVKTTQPLAAAGIQLSPRTAAQYPPAPAQSSGDAATGSTASPAVQSGGTQSGAPATPAVTAPGVTAPAVTAPAVTTPAVTAPAVTTPAVSAPTPATAPSKKPAPVVARPTATTQPAPVVARPTTTTQPAPVVSSAGAKLSTGPTSAGRSRKVTGS
jgi:RNA polymerase sigma factor (sigma-70 family)